VHECNLLVTSTAVVAVAAAVVIKHCEERQVVGYIAGHSL
jgi:hypothetical protein